MAFGDDHWSLKSWVENTQLNPITGLYQYDDFKLVGTHELNLQLTGSLANAFGEYVSSDSLAAHPEWIYSDEISLVRNDNFYLFIGIFDQFVGGWDDIENWYIEEKTVGNVIEIILMTPNKKSVLNFLASSRTDFSKTGGISSSISGSAPSGHTIKSASR